MDNALAALRVLNGHRVEAAIAIGWRSGDALRLPEAMRLHEAADGRLPLNKLGDGKAVPAQG